MDKFAIDSHKAIYHVQQTSIIERFHANPRDKGARDAFRNLHPVYVEISPVGACNHRCTFCAVDYIGYQTVRLETKRLIDSLTAMGEGGVKSAMYAGEGEPLLHKDMAEIVNHAKSVGIDNSFTTNGVHLREDFLEKCGQNISWIKVSFNAGTRETYAKVHRTQEADFDKVVKNLRHAVEWRKKTGANLALGFQSLLLPENADTMEDLVELAKDIGLDYVVIKPYSQHKFSNTHIYENIDYNPYLDLGKKLEKYNSGDFNVVVRVNTIKNWLSQNEDRYCKCLATPSMWGYVMADGSVYSCSAYLLDDRFKLGNINEKNFSEIWTSEAKMEHVDFIRNDLDINECRVNCRMDQVNRYLDKVVNKTPEHVNFI